MIETDAASNDRKTFKIPILSKASLPILSGLMRGQFWLPASGGKLVRVLLGTYEPPQSQEFQRRIGSGSVVYDIGAAHGYYTLFSSRLVGPTGQIISFEPSPMNFAFLERHCRINKLKNITLIQSAVGAEVGEARFSLGTGTGTGHLEAFGDYPVSILTIDSLEGHRPPTHMKIDVEGAELDVLHGAERTLREHRPTIFLSTHGPEVHQACCDYLKTLGYTLQPMEGDLGSCTELVCAA